MFSDKVSIGSWRKSATYTSGDGIVTIGTLQSKLPWVLRDGQTAISLLHRLRTCPRILVTVLLS